MQASDILPDDRNQIEIGGVAVRKGTVGAFLANARTACDAHASRPAREQARRDILRALPALRALGLFEVMQVRDPAVARQLLCDAAPSSLRRMPAASK